MFVGMEMSFRCQVVIIPVRVVRPEMTQYEKGKEQRGEEVTDL